MPPRRVEKLMLWVADLTNKKSKMGKSKQKNFLPFPPMPAIMAQDTVAHCGLPGDMEGAEEQVGFCYEAMTCLRM